MTALSYTRPVELIERPVIDAMVRLAALAPPALAADVPDVTLVAIDPASLRALPEWRLSRLDRAFWVALSRLWPRWRSALLVVQPETVIRWHREGFRRY